MREINLQKWQIYPSNQYSKNTRLFFRRIKQKPKAPAPKLAPFAEYWREAKSWYQKALDLWSGNSKPGTLDANGHDQGPQLAQELARCDASLRRLAAGTAAQK
jgi:hypothetical protein